MKEFYPPIRERETDELIIIARSSTDEWQQEGIDQAKEELKRRGISKQEQLKRVKELEKQYDYELNKELENRKTEDYNIIEKIFIVISWPKELIRDWDLMKEGYELKSKRRLQLIFIGACLYALILLWGSFQWRNEEKSRLKEIENFDISEWEKNRIPKVKVDTINKIDTLAKNKNGL